MSRIRFARRAPDDQSVHPERLRTDDLGHYNLDEPNGRLMDIELKRVLIAFRGKKFRVYAGPGVNLAEFLVWRIRHPNNVPLKSRLGRLDVFAVRPARGCSFLGKNAPASFTVNAWSGSDHPRCHSEHRRSKGPWFVCDGRA